MHKYMSKSEVRCASFMNNILDENIKVDDVLDKINSFEQCVSLKFSTIELDNL